MALATRKIADTIEWAKRFAFNRNPVIGNNLEPALTIANLVQQTILSPPFSWWWNGQDFAFTCSPTPATATSTSSTVASGTLTVTATNSFIVGQSVLISAFAGTLAGLNGTIMVILTATSSQFTGTINFANAGPDTTSGLFTAATTQDYSLAIPGFAYVEEAAVRDLTGTANAPGKWFELKVQNELSMEQFSARPAFICPRNQDANGNVSFRVMAAPDKPYPVRLRVQLISTVMTSMNQAWGMPDFMRYVYEPGFLALLLHFSDDPRAAYFSNQFKAALLSRAEGLTEEERNIFLNNWTYLMDAYTMKTQQGVQARQV